MPGRRMRSSLAVIGVLLPFSAFAAGQQHKAVAVRNVEWRENMSIEQHAQGAAAAAATTSSGTSRVAPALERYSDRHILGHRLPALIRTYQLHVPLAEMREALEWWSEELDRILDRQPERKDGQT